MTLSTASSSSPSSSLTMSDTGTLTLTTSRYINSTATTQSRSDPIPSISSTPLISTFLSSTLLSSIPSTSDFSTPTAIPYPSISGFVFSFFILHFTKQTVTVLTSTSVAQETITVTSVVESAVLSTDTPHDTASFAHQTAPIIGIAFAATFLFVLLILLIFLACKRRHSNRSHNSSMEDILSHHTSWRSPLDGDDDEHYSVPYGSSLPPNYPKTSSGSHGHTEGQFFGDHLSLGSGSADSADANATLGGQPQRPPVTHSKGPFIFPSYYSGRNTSSWPWWANTEPLNINKHNSFQPPPLTGDSYFSAVGSRSASSLGLGGSSSSNGHHNPGSSGEALLPRGSTRITEPRRIHRLSGRKHYFSTPLPPPPPTTFILGHDPSIEYGMQRIRQHQEEEQKQQDHIDNNVSQAILARLHASRRLSTCTTVKAYSHCTTSRSEESASSSQAPSSSSYIYSPSLLNPPISMSQTVPQLQLPRGVTGNDTLNGRLHHRQGVGDTSETLAAAGGGGVTFKSPRAPSPVPTDTSSMVEGLLHPRLGIALAQSQQASVTSLRDHEDYTRPINGLVNNHIRSTTTFETQDTVDLS